MENILHELEKVLLDYNDIIFDQMVFADLDNEFHDPDEYDFLDLTWNV